MPLADDVTVIFHEKNCGKRRSHSAPRLNTLMANTF